jgi:hypothetical protein
MNQLSKKYIQGWNDACDKIKDDIIESGYGLNACQLRIHTSAIINQIKIED